MIHRNVALELILQLFVVHPFLPTILLLLKNVISVSSKFVIIVGVPRIVRETNWFLELFLTLFCWFSSVVITEKTHPLPNLLLYLLQSKSSPYELCDLFWSSSHSIQVSQHIRSNSYPFQTSLIQYLHLLICQAIVNLFQLSCLLVNNRHIVLILVENVALILVEIVSLILNEVVSLILAEVVSLIWVENIPLILIEDVTLISVKDGTLTLIEIVALTWIEEVELILLTVVIIELIALEGKAIGIVSAENIIALTWRTSHKATLLICSTHNALILTLTLTWCPAWFSKVWTIS